VEQTRKSLRTESCREVAKTCGREATGVEFRLSRRMMMALKGTKTQGGTAAQAVLEGVTP
jgi:hypothetical protein